MDAGTSLEDRVVVVTGASSGIGRETALACARRGGWVLAVARRESRLVALIDECREHSPASGYLAGDLGERAFAERVVAEAVERYGRVDVLINNAAMPCHKPVYDLSVEDAERVMHVNFFSCLWTTFAAIPHMLRQEGGRIVNISSFASLLVPPFETMYAASKCAMNGFTEGLWNDLAGSGIHVSLIHPGPIETEIWGKLDRDAGFSGRKYPASVVVDEIFRAIERGTHEAVAPRRNPLLMLARLTRFVAPGLARAGAARMDPMPQALVDEARARARAGKRMGEA